MLISGSPDAGGCALLDCSSSLLAEMDNVRNEHLGRDVRSAAINRLRKPIEGHVCRCAMVAMIGSCLSILSPTGSTFRNREVLALQGCPRATTAGRVHPDIDWSNLPSFTLPPKTSASEKVLIVRIVR